MQTRATKRDPSIRDHRLLNSVLRAGETALLCTRTAVAALLMIAPIVTFSQTPAWHATNAPTLVFESIAVTHAGTILVGSVANGIYRSTDTGSTWQEQPPGSVVPVVYALTVAPDGNVFAGTYDGGMYRSTDDGLNWTQMNYGITNTHVLCAAADSNGGLYAGTYGPSGASGEIYYSSNNGASWIEYKCTAPIYKFAVKGRTMVFAGTDSGKVYRTTDQGQHWATLQVIPSEFAPSVGTLAVERTGQIFAGMFNLLYGSTDDGQNWEDTGAWFPRGILVIMIGDSDYVYAGSPAAFSGGAGAVWRSVDHAVNWVKFDSGLGDLDVYALLQLHQGYLFAATDRGIFTTGPATVGVNDGSRLRPSGFLLEQNFPNPFNPSTSIAYTVGGFRNQESGFSRVHLAVYDLLGREVAVLVNERKAPGRYEVTFDGSRLASGVYVYRLQAGSIVDSKKMVVVK